MNIEQIIRDNLKDLYHLSLATCVDDKPWACEVHFAYDDSLNLYFRSTEIRRHSQEIEQNPFVAGNVVKQHGLSDEPVSVSFEGRAHKLTTEDEKLAAFNVMKERQVAGNTAIEDSNTSGGHQFYKITVSTWYAFGKFDGESNKKYELSWNK